ncbi:hypothetical protein DWUX_1692 [Desulfovibrio diazotrophicus]|nr:hypothetical protein DWUX_1692 [Desulfovibrio diazotrophicus]
MQPLRRRSLTHHDEGSCGHRQQRQLRMKTVPLCICAGKRRNERAVNIEKAYSQR